jgi:hypothetical protein
VPVLAFTLLNKDQCKLENIFAFESDAAAPVIEIDNASGVCAAALSNPFSDDHRELLPKSAWMYWFYPPDEHQNRERVVVGCYVKGPKRTLSYELFPFSELPNEFVSAQDLEAIIVNLLDRSAIQRFEQLPNCRVGTHAVGPNLI